MSIAGGIVCDGGIVMYSDSQETYFDLKWPVLKLITDDFYSRCPMMISGAGFGAAIDSATQQIISKLRTQGQFGLDVALKHIKAILRDIHRNDLPYFPADVESDKQFELLIALKTFDMPAPLLYRTQGSLIYHVPEYAIIGSGSLVNYSAYALFQRYMPMSQAVMLAAHLIRLAKSQLTTVG